MSRILLAVLALLLFCLPVASAPPPEETVLVRLPAEAWHAAQQAGLRPLRLVDYRSFALIELPATELVRLRAAGLAHEVQADGYRLTLGGQTFDPLREAIQAPPGWVGAGGEGAGLHLVQMVGPTRGEWLARLEAAGLRIVRYIHPYTYVVWGEAAAAGRAADAGGGWLRWTGPFEPAYRVQPRWRSLGSEVVEVDVVIYRGAGVDDTLAGLEALGGVLLGRSALDESLLLAGFRLPGTSIEAAARLPGVYSIQLQPTDGGLRGEMSNQVNANNVDVAGQALPGYRSWLATVGIDGTGVTIANVDAGVDNAHPDLVSRMVSCAGSTCGGLAADSHGTHTAGIMAADGSSGSSDGRGFMRGLGMAPGANLVEQLYDLGFDPGGLRLLMAESLRNGASISGNSWGPSGTALGYDNDTMQVDIGVRDADPDAPGTQPLIYVLSIMNGYGGTSSQGTPDEAKNILTVGSTWMQDYGGLQRSNVGDLSNNTAHGPALDGRQIPHLVAPGCSVDSSIPGSYGLMCGTSMASPHVAGAVALFVQYARRLTGATPSPALVKAAFLPVAHDLAGHLDADGNILGHPFDSKQGWGRLDIAAVIDPQGPVFYFDQASRLDDTGQVWERPMVAADPGQPVRLMLAWTDAPGHGLEGSTPAWNNDLDLVVESGGLLYRGNAFDAGGWSLPGGGADGKNNTEGIFLPAGAAAQFTLRVLAANINSDGVPQHGDSTDQDFALVCYNCVRDSAVTWQSFYLPLLGKGN